MARGTIITRTLDDGEKRYDTVIRVNGKQQWKTFLKKKAAEDYLDRHSTDVRDRTYREIKKATFGAYIKLWREINLNEETLKPATLNGYSSIIEHHLLPEFETYQMQAISADEINLFRTRLLKGNGTRALSQKSVRNVLTLLNKIFSDGKKAHYVKFNPMMDVDKPKAEKKKKGRALKPEDINDVLERCSGRLRPIFLTAVLTGMRRAEIFGLAWENVDWDNNVIKVRQSLFWKHGRYQSKAEGEPSYVFVTPKTEESVRDIDLSPALRKELLEFYMKGSKKGLVFCTSNGKPLEPNNIVKRDFRKALKSVEEKRTKENLQAIGHVRWHDLRHTFGSMTIEQGENIYYVMRQMGHSSIQVTIDTYAHLLKDRNPEAAAKTDETLFGGAK